MSLEKRRAAKRLREEHARKLAAQWESGKKYLSYRCTHEPELYRAIIVTLAMEETIWNWVDNLRTLLTIERNADYRKQTRELRELLTAHSKDVRRNLSEEFREETDERIWALQEEMISSELSMLQMWLGSAMRNRYPEDTNAAANTRYRAVCAYVTYVLWQVLRRVAEDADKILDLSDAPHSLITAEAEKLERLLPVFLPDRAINLNHQGTSLATWEVTIYNKVKQIKVAIDETIK